MTKEEAQAILISAFVTIPDLPDDMKRQIAQLLIPSPPVKKRRWRRKR